MPVSESWRAWYSFSACLSASSVVASWRECVRWNIWRANASGAANTRIAKMPRDWTEVATNTAKSARAM
jgi:hypothetical protein